MKVHLNLADFRLDGTEYINGKIREAVENESRTARINGNMIIESAVRIPSNFTLILEDCHLRMADGCYSNMFINEHCYTEEGRTPEGCDRNISILGRGRAIIDGGEYNGLGEKNQNTDGRPDIWRNNLLLFTNVDGFKVDGIHCRNQRWWALNFIYCRNGYIGNIDFCACDIGIAPDGTAYHGLKHGKYAEILVKNADGIDIRQGCHDIVIENISGFTEDDTVALTGLSGRLEKTFGVDGLCSDIYNVTVRNVRSATYCTNVRILNQGGIKIHDVTVDGVYDETDGSPYTDKGLHAFRIGDTYLYGERHATEDETYNITVRNVYGSGEYAVSLAGAMRDFTLYGVECAPGCKMLLDERG